jgi:nitrogen regulatory protein PII
VTSDSHKLITCIFSKAVAIVMLRRLKVEKGITACFISNARGIGSFARSRVRRLSDVTEREILEVVTPAERADEIFEFIFFEADMNRTPGGIIFMTSLGRASHFELPDQPEEES